MGLLTEGQPLDGEHTLALSAYIREHGITQFLVTWNRVKDIQDDELRFGDEIEVGIIKIDKIEKTVKICVKSAELRDQLIANEKQVAHQAEGVTWHPEFGGWMIESTPSRPYSNYAVDLLRVERNMVLRYVHL
jgi:glutamate--cysteine ligase catalytic subunit